MSTINAALLEIGMVVSADVFSPSGQLIVPKSSVLTKQMISQIKFYSIVEVNILDGDLPEKAKNAILEKKKAEQTHMEKLYQTESYQDFKIEYTRSINVVRDCLNDIIIKNSPVDESLMMTEILNLFNKNHTAYNLLTILHSMHQINDSTFAHSLNVSMIARLLGVWIGLEADDLNILTMAGLLHDVGKCRIPKEILEKPGRLTPSEFGIMKAHTTFGYEALQTQKLDQRIKNAALMHHERFDGSGYPSGLKGDEIDDFASIIAIADVYDAMTQDRCYRSGMCPFDVIATFEEEGLSKYNTKYILIFLKRIASSYLNCEVLLSNNKIARIIYLNSTLTKPILQLEDGSIYNLEEHLDVYIQAII
ncbi:HDIG domain-containing protein [Lachnospiraceae bacterium C7]|nr:HDIG domain-containing protein [Lachnospiraceae bacterium C7]